MPDAGERVNQGAQPAPTCPVCGADCASLGDVDFNRSCAGALLPPAGRAVRYVMCRQCSFAFAPEFSAWSPEDFRREIYNAEYSRVDPDHAELRPAVNARTVLATFGESGRAIRHLDYGGGAGRLSQLLREAHWRSASYDPFFDRDSRPEDLGQFELITCFEVFEHVADVHDLARRLVTLLAPDGLILASTLVSDGQLRPGVAPEWWYLAPRNGHVSLFSARSLGILAARHGLTTASFSADIHLFWRREFPAWARHLLAPQ
jgi:SAM-dependent methyltransferase